MPSYQYRNTKVKLNSLADGNNKWRHMIRESLQPHLSCAKELSPCSLHCCHTSCAHVPSAAVIYVKHILPPLLSHKLCTYSLRCCHISYGGGGGWVGVGSGRGRGSGVRVVGGGGGVVGGRVHMGLLKLRSLISPEAKYLILLKCHLDYSNHIYIWQLPSQLSCGDTCYT